MWEATLPHLVLFCHLSVRFYTRVFADPRLLTWSSRCDTTSFQATPTSIVPLGTDVGLLVVLDAFAASLCAAYVVLVYVLNPMY